MVRVAFMAAGLLPQTGSMSTLVTGEAQVVFAALHDAFLRAATMACVVLTVGRQTPARWEVKVPVPWDIFERAARRYEAWSDSSGC